MSLFCSRDFDSDELEDDRVPPPSVLKQEIQDRFAPVSLPDLPPPPQDQPPVYPEESSQSTVGALSMENSRVTSTKKVVIGKKPVVKSIKKSLKHAASSEVSRCKKAATAPKRCRRPSSGPKPETSPTPSSPSSPSTSSTPLQTPVATPPPRSLDPVQIAKFEILSRLFSSGIV